MSESHPDFSSLMKRIQQGCPDAARELLAHYEAHLLRVIRRKLNKRLRPKFDSLDFVQAVWASFFANPPRERVFERPEDLVGYLVRLAQNKVIDAVRQRLQTQKHNLNREHSLDGSAAFQAAGLTARQPTPSQLAVAREEWDRLLQGQPAHYQQILDLRRQGHSPPEIARELGLDETTVRRALHRLARRTLARSGPGAVS